MDDKVPSSNVGVRAAQLNRWASLSLLLPGIKDIVMGLRTVCRVEFSVLAFAFSAAGLLAGCTASESHEKLRLAALALNNSSIACVDEVKTLKVKYETAPSCVALQALAQTYADLGGFGGNIPKDIEVVGERARVYAWMARAVAASGNPTLAIWVVR